ncbi:MAG: J domain-containing protein [Bdellovibrionales bacterium]|nr:J domain-containing protein [Bdellovibrionales bacterium]
MILLKIGVCFAEGVSLLSLSLPVDEVESVDGQSVRVRVFGSSSIVPRSDVGRVVLEKYLSNPEKLSELPIDDLLSFVAQGADVMELLPLAKSVFSSLKSHPDASEDKLMLFLHSNWNQPKLSKVFSAAVGNGKGYFRSRKITDALIYYSAIANPSWLLKLPVDERTHLRTTLAPLVKEHFDSAMTNLNLLEGERVVKLVGVVYGEESGVVKEYNETFNAVKEALAAAENDDMGSLQKIIDRSQNNKQRASYIGIVSSSLLHREASKAIENQDAKAALLALSQVEIAARSPLTTKLLLETLRIFSVKDLRLLSDIRLELFLLSFAQSDDAVRKELLALFDSYFSRLVSEGDIERAQRVLARVLELRHDPSADNDELRYKFITYYLGDGNRLEAGRVMSQVQTEFGLLRHFGLFLRGMYINKYYVLFCILLVSGLLVVGTVRRISSIKGKTELDEGAAESSKDRGTVFSGMSNLEFEDDWVEYESLLMEFSLPPSATLSDIKSAYRNAVKAYHPDKNPDGGVIASERFIKLQEAYERLVELEVTFRGEKF